jgi:RimJ/RimL family protein N-acetyltransferase
MTVSDVIKTSVQNLEMRPLSVEFAFLFFQLVQSNRAHLTRNGDYEDLVASSVQDCEAELSTTRDESLRMGIFFDDQLIGRVDLNPARAGVYVLGYWVSADFAGRGFVTECCRAAIGFARASFSVAEFWAGVRHVNVPSIGVVTRLGFEEFERLPHRSRYRLLCVE